MYTEKETVLIPLLLKPMTKTIRLNNIAIMIYHGGCPVLKISIREINYNHRTKTFNIQTIRNDVVSWRYR